MASESKPSKWIIDADEQSFERDVIERSRELPVVVDFWAPWCGPCRQLGPVLEKLANEYNGKFLLAKANVDTTPNVAGSFNVQSIPAVYALRDAALVDFFVGVKNEAQLRAWIDHLLPSEAEALVAQAGKVQASDAAAAESAYRRAAELDPNLASAKIGLAGLFLELGRADEARAIVDELEKRGYLEPEAETLKARLHLAASPQAPADLDALRAAAADSKNFQARVALAEALAAAGQYEEALETALGVVETHDKQYVEPARQLMVDIFRLLGEDSELTTTFRRRLSTALY